MKATKNSLKPTNVILILIIFALIKLAIHLLTNAFAGYGIFRDELYYLACADRLDWGYVDQPPLSVYLLARLKPFIGDSVFIIRMIPAVFGAMSVYFAGLLTYKMGGKIFAVVLTCLAVILAPIFLAFNTIYSINSLDVLFWIAAAYLFTVILKENDQKLWLDLGIIVGLGMMNKVSMVWFAIGLIAALAVTDQRKWFKNKWFYFGAVAAIAIFTPYIIWNISHDFAHIEFIRNATQIKNSGVTAFDFIMGQIIYMNPINIIIAGAGLHFLFLTKNDKRYMPLGIIFAVTFVILFINWHSKPEYIAAAYPILLTAGAVKFEGLIESSYKWIKFALPAVLIIFGLILAPYTLPFLPVEKFIAYSNTIGISFTNHESKETQKLHQFYADMHGWEKMAKTVSEVYKELPRSAQRRSVIFAQNYGEAGAMEYYSDKYELPKVISAHNNYWLWGYGDRVWKTFIVLGGDEEELKQYFKLIYKSGEFKCDYCMPYENNRNIYICTNPKLPLDELWEKLKMFI